MPYILGQPQRANLSTFCYFENAFTPEECDKIIEYGLSIPVKEASIAVSNDNAVVGVKESIRKSNVSWISWSPDVTWIFQRLEAIVHDANNSRYGFHMSGFGEDLQFAVYDQVGSHYGWHKDWGNGEFSIRKLSISVQLSDPDTYVGGDLEFFSNDIHAAPRKRGTIIVFPSFETHRVTPLESGTRHSLVGWVSGPPFA